MTVEGRFILSLNDLPETRALFARFRIDQAATTYTISGAPQPRSELIITRF